MLCKLIKFHSTDLSGYANETFEDILIHICDGISDWEEIDDKEYWKIMQWISDSNRYVKKGKYILVEKPEITLKFCIQEQIKRENESTVQIEDYKKRKAKILEREKKKEEKERKKLEELKKKYGEQ